MLEYMTVVQLCVLLVHYARVAQQVIMAQEQLGKCVMSPTCYFDLSLSTLPSFFIDLFALFHAYVKFTLHKIIERELWGAQLCGQCTWILHFCCYIVVDFDSLLDTR